MSAGETVPILVSTSSEERVQVHGALGQSICSDSSAEDISLVPEICFETALDSPSNRESQPLLGGFDVSYNQFPGDLQNISLFYYF